MSRSARFAALALAPMLLLGGCTSLARLADGDRIVVRLYDADNGVRLELANESHPDYADVYSQRRTEAVLKLAPDELMDDLVRDLERLDFATLSEAGPPPVAGARGWVELRLGEAPRTFTLPAAGATGEQLQAFAWMKLVVAEYYSHLGGLQFIENPAGHALFRESR